MTEMTEYALMHFIQRQDFALYIEIEEKDRGGQRRTEEGKGREGIGEGEAKQKIYLMVNVRLKAIYFILI